MTHLGNFPKRTLGNLGNFSAYSPDYLTSSGKNVTAPLNFKSFDAYGHDLSIFKAISIKYALFRSKMMLRILELSCWKTENA